MSGSDKQFSDEYLNAFVDGQLAQEEKDRLFEELNRDPELSRRVCELNKLHEMVQFSYDNPPQSKQAQRRNLRGVNHLLGQGLAAALLIAVGVGTGWVSHGMSSPSSEVRNVAHLSDQQFHVPQQNVVLHLDSDDPGKLLTALEEAEVLLEAFEQRHKNYAVEVVVNDGGMDLLRADRSPFPEKVAELSNRFNNVSFLACANAIGRLQDAGITVKLLPNSKIAPSALDQIIRRLDEGWIYLKV